MVSATLRRFEQVFRALLPLCALLVGCGGETLAGVFERKDASSDVGAAGATSDAGSQSSAEGGMAAVAGMSSGGTSGGSDAGVDLPGGGARTCEMTSAQVTLEKEPVDIILVLDNSGSMVDELEAVEQNINVNFAEILESSAIDYRLILISRHRKEDRSASEEASTSICIESPLSGLDQCPAEEPVLSQRFFQYSTKIESTDSFDVILDTFEAPFAETEREDKYDNAPDGWHVWLRPDVRKVFLEMTDDNAAMPVDDFVEQLTDMAPEHFGEDADHLSFTFHSIIGIAEKTPPTAPYEPSEPIESDVCTGNDNDVENAGESFQELSRRTGGLRFPLCQFNAYDVVFQTIAEDVVVRSIECDFLIPDPPDDQVLVLDEVAVKYVPGDGSSTTTFKQVSTSDDCALVEDGFYIEDRVISLCPDTCTTIQDDKSSSVDVLYTCESTIIPT